MVIIVKQPTDIKVKKRTIRAETVYATFRLSRLQHTALKMRSAKTQEPLQNILNRAVVQFIERGYQ